MGMYASGIPAGLITDRVNPRLSAVIGMFCLLLGYYPIKMGTSYTTRALDTADMRQPTTAARVP
jgi:hypothetical protein